MFSETRKPIYSIAALQHNLKLIYWPGVDAYALFDLDRDPDEITSKARDPHYETEFQFLRDQIEWFRTTHYESFWNY